MTEASKMGAALEESEPTTEPLEIPKTKWRPGCLTYGISVLLLVLLGGWMALWFWERAEQQVFEAEVAEMQARGEPVWFADLKPDPLPPDQDGTELFFAASRSLDAKGKQPNSALKAFYEKHYDGTGPGNGGLISKYSAADLANFRAVQAEFASEFELLRQSLDRGRVQVPVDYDTPMPFGIAMDPTMTQREFARQLHSQGILALADGNVDAAVGVTQDLFRLADVMGDDDFLVSQLVRVAVTSLGIDLAAATIETYELTSEQRQQLDEILEKSEHGFHLKGTYVRERAALLTTITRSLADPEARELLGIDDAGIWVYSHLTPLQYRDMTMSVKLLNRVIENVDEIGPAASRELQQVETDIADLSGTYLFTRMMLPAASGARHAALRHRQKLRGMRVALRVDQFYREHQRLPTTLNEVLDEAMPQIPLGAFSGKPIVYRPTANGFMVYCVGENGIDDGGGGDQEEIDGRIEITYPVAAGAAASKSAAGGQ